jgi:hypothetical protein
MKKIALLLSGLPRMWQPSLSTQLDMFQKYQVDVFFHFWDTIDQAEKAAILKLTRPKAHIFEPPKDFSDVDRDPVFIRDNINVPSRLASQYYSWRRVADLFEPHMADYDFAMRSRADLQFVYSVEHIFEQLKPNDLLIPWWEENKYMSDIFALGDKDAIFYYHTMYDHMREYAATVHLNPELFMMHHLMQRKDLHIYSETFKYFFVRRPHMADYTVEQCMEENPGRSKWMDPEIIKAHEDFHRGQSGDDGIKHVKHFQAVQLTKLSLERKKRDGF